MAAWSRQERPAPDSGTITWAGMDVPGDNTELLTEARQDPIQWIQQCRQTVVSGQIGSRASRIKEQNVLACGGQ